VTSPDLERLARVAYEAHRGAQTESLPSWEDTTAQEQQAWMVAVSAVTNPGEATLTEGVNAPSIVVKAEDQTYTFHKDFTVGRQGTLPVSDDRASTNHALFQFAHTYWYVKDLDSTNGTWLNGRRIYNDQRLRKGDKIRVGRTVITVLLT
jgi:D-hexose-6-phosphate mutarotase